MSASDLLKQMPDTALAIGLESIADALQVKGEKVGGLSEQFLREAARRLRKEDGNETTPYP